MSTYPGTIDTTLNVVAGTTSVTTALSHSSRHNTEGSAVVALETILGTANASLAGVLANFGASDKAAIRGSLHFGTSPFTIGTTVPTQGQYLAYNGTEIVGSAAGFTSPTTTKGDLIVRNGSTDTRFGTVSDGKVLYSRDAASGTVGIEWRNAPAIKGDLWTSEGGSTSSVLPIGINFRVLTADSSQATGMRWSPSANIAPVVGTLTDSAGGTLAINAQLANMFNLTIGTTAGNRTFGNPTNSTDGQPLFLRVKNNASDTGTILFSSDYRFSSDVGTPSLGTASTWNYYEFRYGTTDAKWDFQGQSKNII